MKKLMLICFVLVVGLVVSSWAEYSSIPCPRCHKKVITTERTGIKEPAKNTKREIEVVKIICEGCGWYNYVSYEYPKAKKGER